MERQEMHSAEFCWGNLFENEHLEDKKGDEGKT